jgi:hypothetical protein
LSLLTLFFSTCLFKLPVLIAALMHTTRRTSKNREFVVKSGAVLLPPEA